VTKIGVGRSGVTVPKGVEDTLYFATSIPGAGANAASYRKGSGYSDRGVKVTN